MLTVYSARSRCDGERSPEQGDESSQINGNRLWTTTRLGTRKTGGSPLSAKLRVCLVGERRLDGATGGNVCADNVDEEDPPCERPLDSVEFGVWLVVRDEDDQGRRHVNDGDKDEECGHGSLEERGTCARCASVVVSLLPKSRDGGVH